MPHAPNRRRPCALNAALALPLAVWLTACGGGGGNDSDVAGATTCSVAAQKAWLADYLDEWYFWYRLSPRPNAGAYSTVDAYYDALLYTGGVADFPADRWSYSESTESFNRFFGNGQTLGWGMAVSGLEAVADQGPLYVRLVEPLSPAGLAGVLRGDQVISVNGRSAADMVRANDFSALTPGSADQALELVLRRQGSERIVQLRSAVFSLTPVPLDTVLTSPAGRRLGYVVVKDMISQVDTPVEAAFRRFRAANVDAVVLDLRYNGGGLVSVANTVASYLAGQRGNGRVFASLLYNDKRAAANNTSYRFTNPDAAVGAAKAYVLMGARTCSASEQVINGLRGVGIEVVAIGDASCGKPVGFLPQSSCGTTYSAVNFESVNERNEGRYFDGFAATCPVQEDFTQALGNPAEPLLATALQAADLGR
ncbi:MAG: peptidase S41, partial [Chitinophagaceae bacterium]|nr:peptidase S41 [Rubrivivax sp.]